MNSSENSCVAVFKEHDYEFMILSQGLKTNSTFYKLLPVWYNLSN